MPTLDEEIAKTLPDGWFVLYCPYLGCQTTLLWTNEVNQEYEYFEEWTPTLIWAVDNCEHKNHHIPHFYSHKENNPA